MPYATIGDVQARMPQFTLTATSKPTIADATIFIDDVEAEISAALANLGYVMPITGPLSLAIVRAWSAQGAIARILAARAAAVGGEGAVASAERAQKLYDDKFKQLADENYPLTLIDATMTGEEVSKTDSGLDGSGTNEIIDGSMYDPRVTMDQKF